MKPLYLIACSNAKLDKPAQARDLYQGQAFKFAMAAAERAGADVLILSALHGVLEPIDWVSPYNRALCSMSTHQRKVWAAMSADNLRRRCVADREITVLAGKNYAAAVATFPNVRLPLKGQGIGQQLKTLKHLNT
jgi:cytoplasmic iron level regulating protein YaaA (DUF328/UPF0246 family)